MTPWLEVLHALPLWAQALIKIGVPVLVAVVVDLINIRLLVPLARRTRTTLDDTVLLRIRAAVFVTVVDIGVQPSIPTFVANPEWATTAQRILTSVVIVLWTVAFVRIAEAVVLQAAKRSRPGGLINKHTQPILETSSKLFVGTVGVYILLDAWGQDLSVLLASATVSGIALGFAAQETLGNLFAGVFLFTDPPFKLGDYLLLPDGTRGRVLDIRLRTTRLLTNDGVEITLPNREVANVRITNETGGPFERARVRVVVEVAYGTDLHHAHAVLLQAAQGVPHFQHDDEELAVVVRWRAFQGSGIEAEVLGWISNPEQLEDARHKAILAVYDGLAQADIEIPFSTHTVHLVRDDAP